MHKIAIYSIGKKDEKYYEALYNELLKNAKKYATIKMFNFYNKKINQAQSGAKAKEIYTQILSPYIEKDSFNIALHPAGKELDSFAFAKLFDTHQKINFFIGGAYGFEDAFVQECDVALSLSKLTMSHKVAKAVLLEQIFRGLSIVHKHPYHK